MDDDGDPVGIDGVEEGGDLFWEDSDGDAYPVTVIKILGESKHMYFIFQVNVCVCRLVVRSLLRKWLMRGK